MKVERGVTRLNDTVTGEPRFMGRYFAGRSDSGKRIYMSRTFPTQQEAQQWYEEYRKSAERPVATKFEWPEKFAKISFMSIRAGAKHRSIPFDLSFAEFEEIVGESKGRCSLTGIRFDFEAVKTKSRRRPYTPSLDRIDCSRGYSKDNCRLICSALNFALGDWGLDPVIRIARALIWQQAKSQNRSRTSRHAHLDARLLDKNPDFA